MARAKSTAKPGKYKWIAHIQHHFNDKERKECTDWITERESDLSAVLDEIVQKQVGLKITYSTVQDGYQITLQPKDKSSPYCGYTIGVSHADLTRGVRIAQYLVAELLENEAVPLPETASMPNW